MTFATFGSGHFRFMLKGGGEASKLALVSTHESFGKNGRLHWQASGYILIEVENLHL
jgi:hypothetical protein